MTAQMTRTKIWAWMNRGLLWVGYAAAAVILLLLGSLLASQTFSVGPMLQAEEVKYVKVLDGSTGHTFTVRDTRQIRELLRCLPPGQRLAGCMPGNGFLLEFVCNGSQSAVQYALNAATFSPRNQKSRRYCEEYLRLLENS